MDQTNIARRGGHPRQRCKRRLKKSSKNSVMAGVSIGPKGKKRPSDVISSAVKVIRIASGEESEDFGPEAGENQAAAELGRMGGTKRAEDMTPERPA
jgi:hypothetical protein